jgi:serine/threonine-protein kinase
MDATAPKVPLSERLLQESLLQDAVPREMSVARFMRGMMVLCCVASLLLIPLIGRVLGLSLAGLTAVFIVYYSLTLRALRQGHFHPAFQWLDSAVSVSIPAVACALDIAFHDPFSALTAPQLVGWGALITVCALRAGRKLAYAAATLAVVEYLGLYIFMVLPRLTPDAPRTLMWPLMTLRAAFLFMYGPLSATLAEHLVRKAEEALRAIREKDVMGKYFLHERLGAGGMAEVFRATYSPEGGFEKQVAVKRVLPAYADDEEFISLFRREAELGSMLIHPNVVQVLDLGRHQGTLFLAMEYVDGLPLSALLRRLPQRRLPPAAVAYLGAEVALALAYVHGRTNSEGEPLGLVHRDINPPNILVSRIGEVKLSDFGIARAAHLLAVTQTRTVRGKAGYMAPEQARGKPLDGRADLFALGLTLYEALSGQRVRRGDNEDELMRAAIHQEIPPLSELVPDVSPALESAIMGLLQPDLSRRTRSGDVLHRQLLDLTGPEAPYPHGRQRLVEAVRRALVTTTGPKQALSADMAVTERLKARPEPRGG